MDYYQKEIYSFGDLLARMRTFLQKFIKIIAETEKKFDLNSKRLQKYNLLLYEYE